MSIFCSQCGNKVTDDTQYCHNCGAALNLNGKDANKKITIENIDKKEFLRTNKNLMYKVGAGLMVVVILLFFYSQYNAVKLAEISAFDSAQKAQDVRNELTKVKEQALKDVSAAQSNVQAYINKNGSKPSITDIVNKWHPIIAYVYCEYTDSYGTNQAQSGSGTLIINKDGSRSILTNYHVVSDNYGYIVNDCTVKLPNDDIVYTAYKNDITTTQDTADVAYINIKNLDSYLQNMTTDGRNYCTVVPSVGDEVVIIGYPGIGSQTDITATDGIISGYDTNYYITSAKVAHGNSGGAAIDVARNCYLGIPTAVKTDTAESLARILKWQAF